MAARQNGKSRLWPLSVLSVLAAIGLTVWLLVLAGGVSSAQRGRDASSDLPVNVRNAADFTEQDGLIRYPGARLGLDVSSHQGEIDWQKVRAAGIDFAIIRIGYRGYSAGGLNEDSTFRANVEQAHDAGIAVGYYFFSQAISAREAEEEAEFVLSLLDGLPVELPVFYDWEEIFDDESRTAGKANAKVADYANAFCEVIRKAGLEAGVYFNQQYGYTIMHLTEQKENIFWLAEYRSAPSFFYDAEFWQYTGSGRVDGINADVDLDLWFQDGRN